MVLAYHYYNRKCKNNYCYYYFKIHTHTHNSLNNSCFSTVRPVWSSAFNRPGRANGLGPVALGPKSWSKIDLILGYFLNGSDWKPMCGNVKTYCSRIILLNIHTFIQVWSWYMIEDWYSSPLNALIVVLEVVQFFSTRWLCDFRLTPHEGRGWF